MTNRQKYFLSCCDGIERTSAEIGEVIGLKPTLATQFLVRLKTTLVHERSEYKLYRISPVPINRAAKWRLEKRNKEKP